MRWRKLTVSVDRALADPVTERMEAGGGVAVTLEDAGDDAFLEAAFPTAPAWQRISVSGLFPEEADIETLQRSLLHAFPEIRDADCSNEWLPDEDWEKSWMASFEPVRVGKALWVVPSWCEPVEPGAINLRLDPGLAFGTGTHPTTAMCLDWLSRAELAGRRVLDYGCGSGILAIAAVMLGARRAVGVDVDPLALRATRDNAKLNHVPNAMSAVFPPELSADFIADVVVANILANVIMELADTLLEHLADGGYLLLTGVLEEQVRPVAEYFGAALRFDVVTRDQWCMMIGQR